MRTIRGFAGLAASVLVSAAALAQEELPEWSERKIDFVVKEEPLELRGFSARPGQEVWPSFAATFAVDSLFPATLLREPGVTLLLRGEPVSEAERHAMRMEKLLSTTAAGGFSRKQVDFVQSSSWVQKRDDLRDPPKFRGKVYSYTVYAVTEEDARLMAEAALELFDAQNREYFEKARARLLEHRAALSQAQEDLPKAERESKELWEACKAAQKATPYKEREAAHEDVAQLDVSLRSLEVSIAGINAKIDAIQRIRSKKGASHDDGTLIMLDRMLIEQDVELVGARAQKGVLEQHRSRAQAFLAAGERHDRAVARIHSLRETIKGHPKQIEGFRGRLRRIPTQDRVTLYDSVAIQRIKYTGE